MLFKAHRIQHIRESYKLLAPILQTLTRDSDSLRVREIRANEDAVESIYDVIHHEETQFKLFNERREPIENIPKDLFYNEADAIEDKILFAEEEVGPSLGLLSGGEVNSLNKLESTIPDMKRFVYDLDTDDELPDDEAHGEHTCGKSSESEDDWEEDDFDSDSAHDGVTKEKSTNDQVTEEQSANDEAMDGKIDTAEVKVFARYLKRHAKSNLDPSDNMHEQFGQFIRREACKGMCHLILSIRGGTNAILAFKESWHQADLEPGARERYLDAMELAETMEKLLLQKRPIFMLGPCIFLDLNPNAHRRVIRDMQKAFAMMALFFPLSIQKAVGEYEGDLIGHMIMNQEERSKTLPDRKKPLSNMLRPKEFWEEWDVINRRGNLSEKFPDEWDQALRPIVARCKIIFPGKG
jgi:hypothetical protein